jgi:hypothetical protein
VSESQSMKKKIASLKVLEKTKLISDIQLCYYFVTYIVVRQTKQFNVL